MKMATLSDKIAALALVVSIVTGGFTLYQWLNTENENCIVAAIEISNKYLADKDIQTIMHKLRYKSVTSDEEAVVYRLLFRLNYIAYLANLGRVNRDYLALQISCDIRYAHDYSVDENKRENKRYNIPDNFVPINIPAMEEFIRKGHPCTSEGLN
jgi:hypothetical protein